MNPFLSVHHRRIIRNETPVELVGVNYGNWMLIESYMIGLPGKEFQMRAEMKSILGEEKYHAFFDTYMDTYLLEEDVRLMKESGFNLIQLPFNYRHFSDDATCEAFGQKGFAYFDRLLALCKKYEMYLLPGLHCVPGAMARDWNAESGCGETLFWDHVELQERTADIWRSIARRYKDEAWIAGYEILNEPVAPNRAIFNRVNRLLASAIREEDKRHIIVISGNEWGKTAASLDTDLFDDPLTIPCTHCYTLVNKPPKLLTKYPTTWEGKPFGKKELIASFAEGFDEERIERPVFVGECGWSRGVYIGTDQPVHEAAEAHEKMNHDLLDYFREKGHSWTFWAWKDLGVLGILSPRKDSPWKQFISRPDVAHLANSYPQATKNFREELRSTYPEFSEDDHFLFHYMSRHHWDAIVLPHVMRKLADYSVDDLKALASSFAFKNCDIDQRALALFSHAAKATLPK